MKPSLSEFKRMPALYDASVSDAEALVKEKQEVIRQQQETIERLKRDLEPAQMRAEYASALLARIERQYQELLWHFIRRAGGDGNDEGKDSPDAHSGRFVQRTARC